jgi:hypothetical protein
MKVQTDVKAGTGGGCNLLGITVVVAVDIDVNFGGGCGCRRSHC